MPLSINKFADISFEFSFEQKVKPNILKLNNLEYVRGIAMFMGDIIWVKIQEEYYFMPNNNFTTYNNYYGPITFYYNLKSVGNKSKFYKLNDRWVVFTPQVFYIYNNSVIGQTKNSKCLVYYKNDTMLTLLSYSEKVIYQMAEPFDIVCEIPKVYKMIKKIRKLFPDDTELLDFLNPLNCN